MNLFVLYSTLFVMMTAMVAAIGIVWRAEQRLDLSYKFFAVSIFFMVCSVSIDIVGISLTLPEHETIASYFRLLGAIFFLFGLWEMRVIVREFDGELQKRKEQGQKTRARR